MTESDPKAVNLMNKIWYGKESTNCDGNIYGYSNLVNLLYSTPKKGGEQQSFHEMVTNKFKFKDTDLDY
jgi:hypothetical protein